MLALTLLALVLVSRLHQVRLFKQMLPFPDENNFRSPWVAASNIVKDTSKSEKKRNLKSEPSSDFVIPHVRTQTKFKSLQIQNERRRISKVSRFKLLEQLKGCATFDQLFCIYFATRIELQLPIVKRYSMGPKEIDKLTLR